ncbi:MAG TPA: dipeptide epimerase [Candidatus Sulfotelmatobacter sp.]|nr:dipeptide epimerase [Candidatus Sulfotelmatobacter sp.]
MIELQVTAVELPLREPFRVAGFTLTAAQTVVVELRSDEHVGYGESAPLARYGDSVAAILDTFALYRLPAGVGPFSGERITAGLPRAARCALDIAVYDLQAKTLGVSVTELLGLEGLARPRTSLTIPIAGLEKMLADVRAVRDTPIIKVKVGAPGGDDLALIEAIRSVYTGTIRLDANEGWTPEQTVALLREMDRFEIELCEQPIPAGTPERLRWIAERSPIPIMADEDAVVASDLGPLRGCVASVNVKLAKCGGIGPAYRMIATARALGFGVMIGCMAESSILTTAAAHLGPLVDQLDIDAPLFLAHDPFSGVRYDNAALIMPAGPGLGVQANVSSH